MHEQIEISVDASRLSYNGPNGKEGDIWSSISIHTIPEGKISGPFQLNGMLLTAVGQKKDEKGDSYTPAYQLQTVAQFKGEATTYQKKVAVNQGEIARADPKGFYHGMTVEQGKNTFVMVGPPVILRGIEAAEQVELFG